MKADLKNIILAFGLVLLAASGGAGFYRFKNHYEDLLAAQYEAFQVGKNQEIAQLRASFVSEFSAQKALIDSQAASLQVLMAQNAALAQAAGAVTAQKTAAALASQQAAQAAAQAQANAQAQALATAQAQAAAAAQAQAAPKPVVVKPSRKSNAS